VWTETRERGVTDCFSLRVEKWGPELSAPGLEIGRLPCSFSSSEAALKAFREQKPHRAKQSRLLSLAPCKGSAIPPGANTLENQCKRPLPQKISKIIQPRPSLPIVENRKTPALGDDSI